MAYDLRWGTNHPGHLVYLLDFSGSMAWNDNISKVLNAVSDVSEHLLGSCETMSGFRNRFSLTIYGYNQNVFELFDGNVEQLDQYLEKCEGQKLFYDKTVAVPRGLTDTALAFRKAGENIKQWIERQDKKGLPIPAPIVINITDGRPEMVGKSMEEAANEALSAAKDLKAIAVPDGNLLLFNIHFDGKPNGKTLRFPNVEPNDLEKKFLYNASSSLNDEFSRRANSLGFSTQPGSRFMISNENEQRMLTRLIAFGSSLTNEAPLELPV